MDKEIQHVIDFKTKPLGSLGLLERLAFKICKVQQTVKPALMKPSLLVFAADHGIANKGVSAYPAEVTSQMVYNFLNGTAAINVFCKQHSINLKVVDAGVNADFLPHEKLIDEKISKGTKNFLNENAITAPELKLCFSHAEAIINDIAQTGCNIIGFGEMGIGNTSSASLLISSLCNWPIEDCVGKGTGLSNNQVLNKIKILSQAQSNFPKPNNAFEALQYFGGFEIAQMCAAMLAAYKHNMLILIDGFIASAAFLCAFNINANIINNAIFCHVSEEKAHTQLLKYFNAEPILNLNLRLGEGTGCALAYPIINSAVLFVNEMASFETAGVSNKSS
jgi:nicotinate-nucleotide--dimethylbenzimidazole phosphoribosyltransferase